MKKKIFIGSAVIAFIYIFFDKMIVLGCIIVGSIFFPEASQILRHYCFGDGTVLYVKPDYIKNSPVIKKHVSQMKVGQKKVVRFRQREDWRLSFAINSFTIEKRKDKIIVSQWTKFDTSGKIKTWLFFFPVSDNIVHTFDCTPFMFRTEWAY